LVTKGGLEGITGDVIVPSLVQPPSPHGRGDSGVAYAGTVPSPMRDKLSEQNTVKEPKEQNTHDHADADRESAGSLIVVDIGDDGSRIAVLHR
jgi:hypothetical protein